MSAVFVPLFFFASLYAQVGLEQSASEAGLFLLIFFAGFATASQYGGRLLDQRGARVVVVPGCLLAALGLALWAWRLPDLDLDDQWYFIVLAGAGIGLLLGPASTDAVNRAPSNELRRDHRHHPNQPQLRGQPRLGHARHDPDPAREGEHRVLARSASGCPRRAPTRSPTLSVTAEAARSGFSERAGRRAQQLLRDRAARLRIGNPDGAST